MATPQLNSGQIIQISGLVSQYISTQREKYGPRAIPVSREQMVTLSGFFSAELLDSTRLLVLKRERVANPDFYPMLRNLGFDNLPDQSAMAAITFCDVVVAHEPFSDGLLFHEFVHVEQYRQLGIPRFSELYVRGFLNGGSYEAIPLEVTLTLLKIAFGTTRAGDSRYRQKLRSGWRRASYNNECAGEYSYNSRVIRDGL